MAWSCWLVAWLASHERTNVPALPMLFIGSFGPFVGAAIVTFCEGGWRGAARFFARGFDPRMGWAVFVVSFFLMPVIAVAGELLHARLTHAAPHFTMTLAEFPQSYLFLFVLGGTLAEEYGWSLLSDKFDRLFALKLSTLMLGAVWALWHLPLFFIVTPGMATRHSICSSSRRSPCGSCSPGPIIAAATTSCPTWCSTPRRTSPTASSRWRRPRRISRSAGCGCSRCSPLPPRQFSGTLRR